MSNEIRSQLLFVVQIRQTASTTNTFRRDSSEPSYDLREEWGDRISRPTDQGWCGASWAVTTAQVAADRFGVTGRGDAALSAQQLLSCDVRDQRGCDGGGLTGAWDWVRKYGRVGNRAGVSSSAAGRRRERDFRFVVCLDWSRKNVTRGRAGRPRARRRRGEKIRRPFVRAPERRDCIGSRTRTG